MAHRPETARGGVTVALVATAILFAITVGASAYAAQLSRGDVVDRWTVTSVFEHDEFSRIRFRDDDGAETGVEITSGGIVGAQQRVVVQPAPGETPPAELIAAVTEWVQVSGGPEITPVRPDLNPLDAQICGTRVSSTPSARRTLLYALAVLWLSVLAVLIGLDTYRRARGAPTGRPADNDAAAHRAPSPADNGSPNGAARTNRSRLGSFAATLGVGVLTALGVGLVFPDFAVNQDTFRDLAAGYDCWAGRVCSCGASASRLHLWQGTLWARLIGATLGAGFGQAQLPAVLAVVQGIGGAVIFAATRRWSGRAGIAVALTIVWLAAGEATDAFSTAWNPSLTPTASALFATFAANATSRGRWTDAALAGVAAVLVLESHIVGIGLAGLWLIACAATARSLLTPLVVAVTMAALHGLLSPGTLLSNIAGLREESLIGPALAAVPLAAIVGLVLRRLKPGPAIGLGIVVAGFAALTLLGTTGLGLVGAYRYAAPVAGPAVVLLAMVAARLRGRTGTIVSVVAAVIALGAAASYRPVPLDENTLTLRRSARIAPALDALTDVDLLVGLHSSAPRPVAALAAMEPGHFHPEGADREATLLWGGPAPDAERWGWTVIELPTGAALLRAYDPWVRRTEALACESVDGPCVPPAGWRVPWEPSPRRSEGSVYRRNREQTATVFRFPIAARPPGDARSVTLFALDMCRPTIVAVEGAEAASLLPAPSVELRGTGRAGWLVVDVPDDCHGVAGTLPTWIEHEPGEHGLEAYANPDR